MRSQLHLNTTKLYLAHPRLTATMAPTAKDEARTTDAVADDDEDDYLNMVIEEPSKKETPLQRMQREKREVSQPVRPNSALFHTHSQ